MKQLLIVAHGSRKTTSNEEVRQLAVKVAENLQSNSENVSVAFLEFASPSITVALDDCFNHGCEEVSILPYFLSSGKHVVEDLPEEIRGAQSRWPDKKITILQHIGGAEGMVNLIAQSI